MVETFHSYKNSSVQNWDKLKTNMNKKAQTYGRNPFHQSNHSVERPLENLDAVPLADITDKAKSKYGNFISIEGPGKPVPIEVKKILKPKNNYINVVSDEENVHPNVLRPVTSPNDLKYSSSKRYRDHFNEEDKANEEFSENDILYEIWNHEKRPSKEVTTTNNTGLTTLREITDTLDESRVARKNFKAKNSKSTKEFYKWNEAFDVKHVYNKRTEAVSSPQFAKGPLNTNIEEIARLVEINISEKNTEKLQNKKKNDEKYEQDIRALKKKLDFLTNANWRLIESSLKKDNYKQVTTSSQEDESNRTSSVYTERFSNEGIIENSRNTTMNYYKPSKELSKSNIFVSQRSLEPRHSRKTYKSNLPGNILNDNIMLKIPTLSPNTILSCFATHDDTIKERIEAELSTQKQMSSGRKSYKINTSSTNSVSRNYMNFKTKRSKDSVYGNKFKVSKLCAKSDRNSTINRIGSQKHSGTYLPWKKINEKSKEGRGSNVHSISIETQFNKHSSLYECCTQQVSAVKIPSQLISDKKRYNAILKDSSSIEPQKNLFPKTAKNKSKGRSKRNSNLMLNNSRNPSVGDSRYSSSVITVKKPNMKSRLFNYKKLKKWGITEIHSNKSNSSMRKTCTPLYMLRQFPDAKFDKSKDKLSKHEQFKKTISWFYEQGKKTKSKSKKKRHNSRKKSTQKKYSAKDVKRPSSAFGSLKHKNLRSNSNKSKHFKNNESLHNERYRSKENTIRQEEFQHKPRKVKVSRNASKSTIKINGFEKIVNSIQTRNKTKQRPKNLTKIDDTVNTEQIRSMLDNGKVSYRYFFNNQYVFLNGSKAPSISMSTRNLSLDKNDQSTI